MSINLDLTEPKPWERPKIQLYELRTAAMASGHVPDYKLSTEYYATKMERYGPYYIVSIKEDILIRKYDNYPEPIQVLNIIYFVKLI